MSKHKVSSPFIAIADYYMLVSLGINNRVPIVVLVSFSVGLVIFLRIGSQISIL